MTNSGVSTQVHEKDRVIAEQSRVIAEQAKVIDSLRQTLLDIIALASETRGE